MSLFSGEYECKMDAKGRLTLPSKVKSKLPEVSGNHLVLFRGSEPCLELYTKLEWDKKTEKINSLNDYDAEVRKFKRNFFSKARDVELDGANRLLIPKLMIKHAELEKEIILVGTGNYMELWNPSIYEKDYLINDPEEYEALSDKLLI